MKIVGINYLSESSVALIENGKLKYAISQERLNRIKNWWGNPFLAIEFLFKETSNTIKDIDYFATHGLSALIKNIPNKIHFEKKINMVRQSNLAKKVKDKQIKFLNIRYEHEIKVNKRTLNNLNNLRKRFKNLCVYDHHKSHAASAYFNSGWKNCYVLTIDGWGDNSSSKFYHAKNGLLKELSRTNTVDSLGYFYGSITDLLGFKPHRHEGKVLGLAAFGNSKAAYSVISKMISYDSSSKSFVGNFEKGYFISKFNNPNLQFMKKKFKREDIAAAAQKRIEDVIIEFIKDNIPINSKIALAGGVFSNVKINQKISELKNIKDIFVFPNMGDGGLAVGSASLCHNEKSKSKFKLQNLNQVYLGPKYSTSQVLTAIKKYNLKYFEHSSPEKFIASELHNGKVVACFHGKMEFGPRSLGNRSILVRAIDRSVNDWLNKKLKRTEFMPFAPITLKKEASKMYYGLKKKKLTTKFMTITCNCTKKAINLFPAAIHIDNTARPQIINKKINSKIYKLLSEYFKISKIPTLINTSFNVHEEPIVCSPEDAIRAFLKSKLDYLYIEDYIVY